MPAETIDDLFCAVGGPSPKALDRLIYVVGPARCGTTLTKNVIGLHDGVISFSGPSHFLNHVWRYRYLLHRRLWLQLLWSPSWARRDVVRDSLPDARRQSFLRLINKAVASNDLRNLYRLYPLVRALDPAEKWYQSEFVAWLDKGNDFQGVGALARRFPEARFVFVTRDPRGAITSLSKRVADMRPDTEFQVEPRDVIISAIYWRNLIQRQLQFAARYPERTILLRYEDLVSHPVDVLRRIYGALDLPPESRAKRQRKLDTVLYGATLNSAERGHGIRTDPIRRWKTLLSPLALDLIAAICAPTAQRLGYQLETPSSRTGWLGIIRHIPGWRGKAVTLAKLAYLGLREPRWRNRGQAVTLSLAEPAASIQGRCLSS